MSVIIAGAAKAYTGSQNLCGQFLLQMYFGGSNVVVSQTHRIELSHRGARGEVHVNGGDIIVLRGVKNLHGNPYTAAVGILAGNDGGVLDGLACESSGSIQYEEEEIDLLDMREQFDDNAAKYTVVLGILSSATEEYNVKVSVMTKRLNQLRDNPGTFSTAQVRGIMQNGTTDTNHLAKVYEQQAPLLREHFDLAMKYAIMMQESDLDEGTKSDNRKHCRNLIDTMIGTRDQFSAFRKILDGFANLDKGLKKPLID